MKNGSFIFQTCRVEFLDLPPPGHHMLLFFDPDFIRVAAFVRVVVFTGQGSGSLVVLWVIAIAGLA
jgi:hypothetical protein